MFALTNFSDKKIGDHTGERPLLVFFFLFYFSFPSFDQFHSLSLWVIHMDSLGLEVPLDFLSFFKIFQIYRDHYNVPCYRTVCRKGLG